MRKSFDEYFLEIAQKVSERSTCDRKHVGCVIVKDKQILCTGYNGSIVGLDHCDDVGHLMKEDKCIRTVHAEMNAVGQSARRGVSIDGSTLYTTMFPCWKCFQLLSNAGIKRIVFGEAYEHYPEVNMVLSAAERCGVKFEFLEGVIDGRK